jgi:hypothetical protein
LSLFFWAISSSASGWSTWGGIYCIYS